MLTLIIYIYGRVHRVCLFSTSGLISQNRCQSSLVTEITVGRTERRSDFRRWEKRFTFPASRGAHRRHRRRRNLRLERSRGRRLILHHTRAVFFLVLRIEHLAAATIDISVPLAHRVHLTEVRTARAGERVADAVRRHAVISANVEETATRFYIGIITWLETKEWMNKKKEINQNSVWIHLVPLFYPVHRPIYHGNAAWLFHIIIRPYLPQASAWIDWPASQQTRSTKGKMLCSKDVWPRRKETTTILFRDRENNTVAKSGTRRRTN